MFLSSVKQLVDKSLVYFITGLHFYETYIGMKLTDLSLTILTFQIFETQNKVIVV